MRSTSFTRAAIGIVIAATAVAGCGASASPSPSATAASAPPATLAPATTAASVSPSAQAASAAPQSGTLTVWLMNGSLNDNTVVQLDTDFQMSHPGWKVNYQVQQWNGIVDKLTTALASDTPPDVIEMGNTQAITFEAAGALADLTAQRQALGGGTANTGDGQLFVDSLNSASVYQDKLFAVPFYAGDRVLIYNKGMFTAAGIDPTTITSKDKLIAAAQTLQAKNKSVKDYSGFYVAGQNWYQLLQNIWDRGGSLATQGSDGTWTANLESAQSMQGIQDYVDYYKAGSTGPKDNDEMNPPEYTLFSQGKVGMFVGNGWEIGSAVDPKGVVTSADQVGVLAIPSATDGKTVPVFLGGSVLGVASKSKNQAQAIDWIKQLTSDAGQQQLISNGWIPSLKAAAANIPDTAGNAILKIQANEAAAGSGFTPNDPRWAGVEANNPIKAMMTKILTGQATVADAAKEADQKIDAVLNAAQ